MVIMKDGAVLVKAHAKINLTLDVIGKRQDGYHDIVSVMQSISIYDSIKLTLTEGDILITCGHPEVPENRENLVFRAAEELRWATGSKKGVHIELSKGIPVAAGLGGGSADAAGVLLGLNRLWDTHLSDEGLRGIGVKVGADVPFCLLGGTALAEGIGEKLTPLPPFEKHWLVLFKPPFGVSTREIYNALDSVEPSFRPDTAAVLEGINQGDSSRAIGGMGNILQQVTASLYPEVQKIISGLEASGAKKVFMCGSGPTVCALMEDRTSAERLIENHSGFSGDIYLAHTEKRGVVLME